MDIGILELNDAGLRLTVGTKVGHSSPGYATLIGDSLLLGQAAMAQSHINPSRSNSQFWHRLSAEPLPIHNSQYRHHADLAYSHLLSVHADFTAKFGDTICEQLVFALPGNFTREQMALLLGIVDQCPFKAVGLVDSAVAASALHAQTGKCLHIDAQLHQCVFTLLSIDGNISRQQIDILPSGGLLALRGQFAKSIAEQFVDQSRFDPLHSAETEQSIFDQLPQWLAQSFQQTDMIVEVAGKTAKISRNELIAPVIGHFQQIANVALKLLGDKGQCIVGHPLASLPGFLETLNSSCSKVLSSPVIALGENAIAKGIQQNIDNIVKSDGDLAFIQTLPISAGTSTLSTARSEAVTPTTTTSKSKRASHVLVGDRAFPLRDTPLFITANPAINVSVTASSDTLGILQRQGENLSLLPQGKTTLLCNNQMVRDNLDLYSGDCIRAENLDGQLQFIEVVNIGP